MGKTKVRSAKKEETKSDHASGSAHETTKQLLISAGIKLFAAQGYAGTSVREISELSNVNISLVSYYFSGKEGLYKACLDGFGRENLELAERILHPAENAEEVRVRLQMFIEQMLVCYTDEPELTAIIHRECELGLPVARDIFTQTFLKVFECLLKFFESAAKKGLIRKDVDPFIAASLFIGSLNQLGRLNSLNEKLFNFSVQMPAVRKKLEEQILPVFLEGLAVRGSEPKENSK